MITTFNFHFRPSVRAGDQAGSLYLRVIHRRRSMSVTMPYRIYAHEWDEKQRTLALPPGGSFRLKYLQDTEDGMNRELRRLERIAAELEQLGEYSVDEVVGNYRQSTRSNMLSCFVRKLSGDLEDRGQERTARAYRTVSNGLKKFNKNTDIRLEHINTTLIKKFESDLRERGKSLNTISYYMRNLRAIYNKAIAEGRIQPRSESPFANVCTGVYLTRKRALTLAEIRMLDNLDQTLSGNNTNLTVDAKPLEENLLHALGLFMFCFYSQGMSFVDMAYLKKASIRGERINYFRKKTGQLLEVRITAPMRRIIDHFANQTARSQYLFPIITDPARSHRLQYETALHTQNTRLKRLAALAGIEKNVSTHVARHSWATIARNEQCPLSVISQGLGHANEKTTYTYLALFDSPVVDQANELVCQAVKKVV